jgi:hypothetical protein
MPDPGNTPNKARKLTLSPETRSIRDTVGSQDTADFYTFKLSRRSNLVLNLSGFKADVNATLLSSRGQRSLAQARRSGNRTKIIDTILNAGTYYLRITARQPQSRTRYTLTFTAVTKTVNLIANTGISLKPGATVPITGEQLRAIDTFKGTDPVVYTLTRLPTSGRLQRHGVALGVGSQFTQADLDQGVLQYVNTGQITQLTNNTTVNRAVGISGSNVAWATQADNNTQVSNIFLYQGDSGKTIPLTDTNTLKIPVGISDANVLWNDLGNQTLGNIGVSQALFYNATTGIITRLTGNLSALGVPGLTIDFAAGVSGVNVVFNSLQDNQSEVFLYNGSTNTTTRLTNDPVSQTAIALSGNNVVWTSPGSDSNSLRVFFYNGATGVVTPLPYETTNLGNAIALSGSRVAWLGKDSTGLDVFLFDGTTGQTAQLTNDVSNQANVKISGANVVWNNLNSNNQPGDVFFYNGSTGITTQLTNTLTSKQVVGISGVNLVWNSLDSNNQPANVFFYNGNTGTTTQLTSTTTTNSAVGISDSNVLWEGKDGNNTELFLDRFIPSDQFGFAITDRLGSVTEGTVSLSVTP